MYVHEWSMCAHVSNMARTYQEHDQAGPSVLNKLQHSFIDAQSKPNSTPCYIYLDFDELCLFNIIFDTLENINQNYY